MPLAAPAGFRHAVYFHAPDLLDEYLRPARVRRDGREVAVDPESRDATARALERRFPGAVHPDHLLMEVQAHAGDEVRSARVHVEHADGRTAMSRATACMAAAGAVTLGQGAFDRPGVHAPEAIGPDATERLLAELARDGIRVEQGARLRLA